jgi:quercetin dioxygenase-like cupin family protein
VKHVHLSSRELDAFGSSGVTLTPHARVEQPGAGFAVDVVTYGAGSTIGRHPTALWQLLVVVRGAGWAAAADDQQVPLDAGDAVLWEPGEEHTSGSAEGMVAVVVQSPVTPLPPV